MTQQGFCNTSIKNPSRSRNYCFTLNNYTEDEVKELQSFDCDYLFQEETGSNGTPHLQGILMFKNAVSFKKLKQMLPRAHLEVCKNKTASLRYCSKKDTRTGMIYSNVEIPRDVGTTQVTQKLSKAEQLKIDLENHEKWLDNLKNDLKMIEGNEKKFTSEEKFSLRLGFGKI